MGREQPMTGDGKRRFAANKLLSVIAKLNFSNLAPELTHGLPRKSEPDQDPETIFPQRKEFDIAKTSTAADRKHMKAIENQGFLTTSGAMGRNVPVKKPGQFKNVNKINGFMHFSYGMTVKRILILIFVIGAAAGLKARADDSNQTTIVCCDAKISVKLNEPTNKIKTNEPVVVTIQIKNTSTNAAFIFHIGNTSSDFTWVITSPTGKDLSPKPDLLHEAISGWNPKLKPLESRESDYDLRSVCRFSELGTYKVVVKKEVFFLPPIRKKCKIVSRPLYITISR